MWQLCQKTFSRQDDFLSISEHPVLVLQRCCCGGGSDCVAIVAVPDLVHAGSDFRIGDRKPKPDSGKAV